MDKELIKKAVMKFEATVPGKTFERSLVIPKMPFDKAVVIVGPRRCGKSYYLYNVHKRQVKRKKAVIVNFEDNLLSGLAASDLGHIVDSAKELFDSKEFVFLLDELQVVKGWENFVVSLLNSHSETYVTGSNSRLLSKDIATALRGKALPFLLLPLSFKEFLEVKGLVLEKNILYGDGVFKLKKLFREYFEFGGFPEIVLADGLELKNRLVNSYFDTIIYKDTVERNGIKNTRLATITAKYLLNLFGNTFSIAAFENYLKSNKAPYSLEDIYLLLDTLRDIYFVSYVKQSSKSFKKGEYSKAKVYLFDNAYIRFLANEPEDKGRALENLVFIELFRRQNCLENKGIFWHKTRKGNECDFIIKEKSGVLQAIQVCYELTDRNRDREIKALVETVNELKPEEALILTNDQQEELEREGVKITVKPVWKWLVEAAFSSLQGAPRGSRRGLMRRDRKS